MRRKDSFLDLEPRISRLIDTLSLELAYTKPDSNSKGLLEILTWKINDTINEVQFRQLYKEWLQSKGVNDVTKVKQTEAFNKQQLLLMDSTINFKRQGEVKYWLIQMSRIIRLLRKQYNTAFFALNKQKGKFIEAMDNLFDMIDLQQSYHLRKPQLLVLFEALLMSKIYGLKPSTVDNYWRMYNSFQKQINIVDNKVSIRAFKNYIHTNVRSQDIELIIKNLDANKYSMNYYDDGIKVWKRYQKELSGKNQMICKRIFNDNQHLFLVPKLNYEQIFTQLSIAYGEVFLALHNIDIGVIQEFGKVMEGVHKKHINQVLKFIDKQQSQTSSLYTNTSKSKTIKIQKSVSSKKSIVKRQSMRTPTKSSQSFFTPRKESAKNKIISPLSKTRQTIESPISNNPNSILQNLSIFKNQRIQSFQTVMKRLKKR